MKLTKKEVIIGVGGFLVALLVFGAGVWWHGHQEHRKRLLVADAKTTSNPNISLNQDDSGGLGVSGQASDLGQLGNSGGQSQKGNASGGSDGLDPATFSQYDKYKGGKTALFGDIAAGSGTQLQSGQKAGIVYKAWLANGTLVDQSPTSSSGQSQPFSFTLGAHQVIPGLEEGVYGMKAGGKRLVIVPPAVGYGAKGQGLVPPSAVMVFYVQLLSVQ